MRVCFCVIFFFRPFGTTFETVELHIESSEYNMLSDDFDSDSPTRFSNESDLNLEFHGLSTNLLIDI